jgi:hypothetical protein
MAAFWHPRLGGTCYSMQLFKSFAMANTGENKEHVFLDRKVTSPGFNIGTDMLSASLPIPIIWGYV